MNEPKVFDPREQHVTWEEAEHAGLQKGLEKGLEKGLDAARVPSRAA